MIENHKINEHYSISSIGKHNSNSQESSSIKPINLQIENRFMNDSLSQQGFQENEYLPFNFDSIFKDSQDYKKNIEIETKSLQGKKFNNYDITSNHKNLPLKLNQIQIGDYPEFNELFPNESIDHQSYDCQQNGNSILESIDFYNSNNYPEKDNSFQVDQSDEQSQAENSLFQNKGAQILVHQDFQNSQINSNQMNPELKKQNDKMHLGYTKIVEILTQRQKNVKQYYITLSQNDESKKINKRKPQDVQQYEQESQIFIEKIKKQINDYDEIKVKAREVRNQLKGKNVPEQLKKQLEKLIQEIQAKLVNLRNRISSKDSRLNKKKKNLEQKNDFEKLVSLMESMKNTYDQFLSNLPEEKKSLYKAQIFQQIDFHKSQVEAIFQPQTLKKREKKALRKN